MTKAPNMKPLSAPRTDGPIGCYVLQGLTPGPALKYEVRHRGPPIEKAEDSDQKREGKVLRRLLATKPNPHKSNKGAASEKRSAPKTK